jgi:hypothetical protein
MEASASAVIASRLEKWIRVEKVTQYVQTRQNEDGGYSFAQGAESSAADTYYGIRILKMLGAETRNVSKTIEFMKRLQHEDGSFDSIGVLLDLQKRFRQLKYELSEFIRKHDYRFAYEGFGPEWDIVERSTFKLSGTSHLSLITAGIGRSNGSTCRTSTEIMEMQK